MTSPPVPTAAAASPCEPGRQPIAAGQGAQLGLGPDRPALLVVTDGRGDLAAIRRLGQAIAPHAWAIYLREPTLPATTVATLAAELTRHGLRVVVADRVDVALASGAFGVELGERSLPTARVRAWVKRRLFLGRSVHDLAGARAAALEGADWLLFGQVYPSRSKPMGEAAGIASLRAVTAAVSVPVLAIGGIAAGRVADVVAAGASGVAVIGAVAGARDPGASAGELAEALGRAGGGR